ncbi:flagellar hook-length control protein FliK [Nitrosospira sp. Nsp18]|uniref:flagellar hook-length control protein FliK n=1 Tax=Nitrosospira sp. Nsp18 TaxID=1855334 RepID=UPI00087E84BB|nr:flagellar hook-length control protein FliK [Nitrosospira sp. Nsp18]SDA12127.1 flagellar hook-length control protein FliK [Nitrosospira sp. Nsp18]
MLTLSALHNTPSSPVSQLKNSAPATDAQEAGQAAAASFGEVLAHEISGKDRSEAELRDEKTAPGKDRDGKVISIGEMEARNAEIKKDTEEKEGNVIVAAVALQPMNMTEILAGLPGARTPGSRTDAGIDVRADVLADTQGSDPADILASMSPAELATAAAQHAGLAASQFSPVIARSAGIPNNTGADIGTGIGTMAAMAAADAGASQNAKLSPDALTSVAAGVAARIASGAGQGGISDPVNPDKTFVTNTFVTNDDAPIKPSKDARQGISPQLEFGSPKFRLADESQQLEKSMLDVAQHNLSATQVEAGAGVGVGAAIPERGSITAASASAAAAGTPVHAAPGLEPRLGAVGWDNALGQKVLWMVSNQQQIAELSLNPPDLGPLQVVLSISDDQVSAMFISQQADVRQALEAALPRLKEMMADSGINLSNTTVSADSTRQQAESEQQNHSGARYGKGNSQMTVPGIEAGANPVRSGVSSLVDTFA